MVIDIERFEQWEERPPPKFWWILYVKGEQETKTEWESSHHTY